MAKIKLQSNDNEVFVVDVEIAMCSKTLQTMLEDLGMDGLDENIPLPNVDANVLRKIIEWATHHKNDPPFDEITECTNKSTHIGEWDKEFLKIHPKEFLGIVLAAGYLDIGALMQTLCKHMAKMIKGKTIPEIRKIFQIDELSKEYEQHSENGENDKVAGK